MRLDPPADVITSRPRGQSNRNLRLIAFLQLWGTFTKVTDEMVCGR